MSANAPLTRVSLHVGQVDDAATPTMVNSLMYKLSYYRFNVRRQRSRPPPHLLSLSPSAHYLRPFLRLCLSVCVCVCVPVGRGQELGYGGRPAMDNVRRSEISRTIKLDTVEEAFTSKNWIVRIYKARAHDTDTDRDRRSCMCRGGAA
jgi:hypothetical protein